MLPSYIKLYNFSALIVTIIAIYFSLQNALHPDPKYPFYLFLCQCFFLIELYNIKIKKSNSLIFPTFMQLSSRIFISLLVLYYDLSDIYYKTMCFSWYLSDCIRYLFYLFRTSFFKWMRYNFFIIFYPIGTGIEIYLINKVYFKHENVVRYILAGISLVYIPGFLYLYWHMIRQRQKVGKSRKMERKRK